MNATDIEQKIYVAMQRIRELEERHELTYGMLLSLLDRFNKQFAPDKGQNKKSNEPQTLEEVYHDLDVKYIK